MATSNVSFAAPIASTVASLGLTPAVAAPATTAPVVTAPAVTTVNSPNAAVTTGYDPTPAAATGGGAVGDFVGSAVANLTRLAAGSFERLTTNMNAAAAAASAKGENLSAADVQKYQAQMSSYELMMQLAAKIQEKQDAAAQVWLRL